jgi:type IX secretion system PorP/SprF family membrane protein
MKKNLQTFLLLFIDKKLWKFIFLYCLSIGLSSKSFAQQDPQYSQYMFNQLAINPAYAGSKEAISASSFLRAQWVGIKGAPNTETFTIHGPMRNKKVGLGLTVIADQVGPQKSVGVLGSYAYRLKVRNGKLSFGLRFGVYQYSFNWNLVTYKDQADFSQGTTTTIIPTADAGLYYYTNSMYAGFSVTHLYNGRLTEVNSQNGEYVQSSPHMFFTLGKAWEISEKLIFNPSCMIKLAGNAPGTIDVNASFLIDQRLWVGLSGRSAAGIVGYTQFSVTDKFRVGYSYDFGFNKIGLGAGSHELMISYNFSVQKPPFFSPRYF